MRVQSVSLALIPFIILAIFGIAHAATPSPDRLSAAIIPPGSPQPTQAPLVFVVAPTTVVPPASVVEPIQPAPTTIPPEPTESPTAAEDPVSAVTIPEEGGSGGSAPTGNRTAWSADEQARETAVLFAITAAGVPSDLFPQFVSMAWCEGRWSPDAYNPGVWVGDIFVGPFYGTWQTEKLWWDLAGEDVGNWQDLNAQARVAWRAYQYGVEHYGWGWAKWHCQP